MSVRKSPASRALFLELVLDLVIFAICATVCVQVFASAKLASETSAAYSTLGIEAQSLAEGFDACDGDAAALAQRFAADLDGSTLTLYYDRDFQQVHSDAAIYTLTCQIDAVPPLREATITLLRGEEQIFVLHTAKYVPAGQRDDPGSTSPAGNTADLQGGVS